VSVLTYLTDARLRDAKDELDGRVLTRPALLVTDGQSVMYACDVDIGIIAPSGYDGAQDLVDANILGSVLHNVPVARGNQDLIYADVGSAVRLRRTASGRYEVTGFSQEMPGRQIRIPVDLLAGTFGMVEDQTITSRPLTLAELQTFGGFGNVPLGAVAIYQGSTFMRLA
jgi:hypothetical protein